MAEYYNRDHTRLSLSRRTSPFHRLVQATGSAGLSLSSAAFILVAGARVEVGALVACLIVGSIVTPIADRMRLPFAAVAFASVVSLLPGVFLFRMVEGLVGLIALEEKATPDLLLGTIADGGTAFLIILAMAFGLIFPKMCIGRAGMP